MTAAFIPYAAIMLPLINKVPFLAISNFYWLVPILLVAYAPFIARRRRESALGMVGGALLLGLSIMLRSIDEPFCQHWPHGTHIAWHTLNALMLPLMIEVYRRHMLAGAAHGR